MPNIALSTESIADEKNRHVLTHWHDCIELIRVIDGKMQCIVNGDDHDLNANDVCIINQKQLHRIRCSGDTSCNFQRIMIEPTLFTADKEIYETYIAPILNDDNFTHLITSESLSKSTEISSLMDQIKDLEDNKPIAYELGVIALLHLIFQIMYAYYIDDKSSKNLYISSDALIHRKMSNFIYSNYHDKITLEEIAASGNVSKSKACNIFNKFAGHSPIDFLNLYRLEVSADLLKTTDQSVSFIAMSCGFGQQSYFNRLFRRVYGMTPRQWRTQ